MIDSCTGKISLKGEVDYETEHANSPLELVVLATDGDASSPLTGTSTVSVFLGDVNDNVPYCTIRHAVIETVEAAGEKI